MVESFKKTSRQSDSSKQLLDPLNFRHLLYPNAVQSIEARILIELAEPGRNYRAGENIAGVIKVLLTSKFDASSISLRLYGYNIACFMPMQDGKMAAGTGKPVRMSETVIDVTFRLEKFPEG